MLYTRILKPANRNFLKGIIYPVLFAFILSLSSCYTVSEEIIYPKELYIKDNYTVLEARMKNDSLINLERFQVTCYPDPQRVKDSLESNTTDSVIRYTTGMIVGNNADYSPIPDIKEGIIKCIKTDTIITEHKGQKEYRFKKTSMEMQFNNISKLKIQTKNSDTFLSVLAWGGFIIGVSYIVFLSIAFAGIRTH